MPGPTRTEKALVEALRDMCETYAGAVCSEDKNCRPNYHPEGCYASKNGSSHGRYLRYVAKLERRWARGS